MGIPIPIDRLLLILGFGALVLKRLNADDGRRIDARWMHWLLVIAGVYAVASTAAAGQLGDPAAVFGLTDRLGLVPWLLFAISPLVFATRRQRNILLGTLVVLGAYLGVTALFSALGADQLVFPQYINDPTLGIHPGRARGPFLQATENGLALSACAFASLVAVAIWKTRWARVAALGVALLCAVTLMLVLERSIWLGFSVAIVLTSILFAEVRRLAAVAALVAAVLLVAIFALSPGLSQQAEVRRNDQGSVWDRQNTDAAALRMIAARPLFGFGWQTFETASDPYFRQDPVRPLTGTDIVLHNVFLSNTVELGLIGATVWMIAICAALLGAALTRASPTHRLWRIGFIALAIEWFVIANVSPLSGPFNYLVLWAWGGIVFGSVRLTERGLERPRAPMPMAPASLAAMAELEGLLSDVHTERRRLRTAPTFPAEAAN